MPLGKRVTRNVVRVMVLSRKRLLSSQSTLTTLLAISAPPILNMRYAQAQSNPTPDQSDATHGFIVNFGQYYTNLNPQTATGLTIVAGLAVVVLCVGAMMFHYRAKANRTDSTRHGEITSLRAALDRAESLIAAQNSVLIAWDNDSVEILGKRGAINGIPSSDSQILAFRSWLETESTDELEANIDTLRSHGESFTQIIASKSGAAFAVEGCTAGARALVTLREGSKSDQRNLELARRGALLEREIEASRALFSALPMPIWIRDADNQLNWVNPAYAGAVGALDSADAVAQSRDLFDGGTLEDIHNTVVASGPYSETVHAESVNGTQAYHVLAVPFSRGSIGLARDSSELESVREKLSRLVQVYARTMDQVETAVASFNSEGRLEFFNTSYVQLWGLDEDWLRTRPGEGEILDALREARKIIPDKPDYHVWKTEQLETGHDPHTPEMMWHLPDGRTLRILSGVHPLGTIYMYDDVSERFELESRHNTLIDIQRETLDNLREGAALFSSAGRLQLYNPTFARMWKLSNGQLVDQPHIKKIAKWVEPLLDDNSVWNDLHDTITSLDEIRESSGRQFERRDGSVIDYGSVPLPGGGTLVTFVDVTDTFRAAESLKERNTALEKADQVKTIFVHHVNYVLRAPLTTIIGYADMLSMDSTGSLNEVQSDYTGHILSAAHSLMAIVDDILDLATINAGTMELELKSIDPLGVMEAAATGIRHRFLEMGTRLDIVDPGDLGTIRVDEKRLRQILFNLLANAVDHSPANSCVTMRCVRDDDEICFFVEDQGKGIPAELQSQIFENFESYPSGKGQRGAGLGLSLAKSLVELHGGTISVTSEPGKGAVFVCRFPAVQTPEITEQPI